MIKKGYPVMLTQNTILGPRFFKIVSNAENVRIKIKNGDKC